MSDARRIEPARPVGLAEVIRRSAAYLERHGVESPRPTVETLLMSLLATDRAGLYSRQDGLDTGTAKVFGRALCQRCRGVPVQHLTGEQQFFDLVLEVRPGVFVPRPETEGLVEVALEAIGPVRDPVVVDVGTGTGAVALAVKRFRPDARVIATDVSRAAVALASANAQRLGISIDVRLGDLLGPVPVELRGKLDLVVSNPPYVALEGLDDLPREVRADPREALVGGTNVHQRLAAAAEGWLVPGGWLVVEIGDEQGAAVRELLGETLCDVAVVSDLAGRDRVVRGRHRPPGGG
jgi:release factor glutamine methyltransferase